jgi:cytochrome P450
MEFQDLPFAPGGKGLLGHNGEFRKNRLGLLDELSRTDGRLMRLRVPLRGARLAVLNDPELVQEMLVEKGRSFDKSAMVRFSLFPLAGEGLFSSNGELWKRQRKLMAPLFHYSVLEGYARDMVEAAHRTIDRWQDGQELALLGEMTRLTMSIAGKTLFAADTFSEADEIGHALTVALAWSGWVVGRPGSIMHIMAKRRVDGLRKRSPELLHGVLDRLSSKLRGPIALIGPRGRELARAIAVLDERVQRMIDERRKSGIEAHADLLSKLLGARDDDGAQMDDRQVRDEVLTLFVAGHETTATGLAWTAALLARHPAILRALQREVDAVGDAPTVADLPRLQLCLRAFREALRLYPPVYVFGRDSRGDVTLGGCRLPEPTNVLISPYALHRRADVWPDPLRFDPDRFLPEVEAARHRYAYLPFGAGPRICIGNHFAYMEAQLAMAVIFRRFDFELLADEEPDPSATLRPRHGVRVRIRARSRGGLS